MGIKKIVLVSLVFFFSTTVFAGTNTYIIDSALSNSSPLGNYNFAEFSTLGKANFHLVSTSGSVSSIYLDVQDSSSSCSTVTSGTPSYNPFSFPSTIFLDSCSFNTSTNSGAIIRFSNLSSDFSYRLFLYSYYKSTTTRTLDYTFGAFTGRLDADIDFTNQGKYTGYISGVTSQDLYLNNTGSPAMNSYITALVLEEVFIENASCGTASGRVYSASTTSFGSDTFCSVGTLSGSSPSFPAVGTFSTWSCLGVDGGSDSSCSASRDSGGATNAICGSANKGYFEAETSFGSDTFCSVGSLSGSSPSFPSTGTSSTWSCLGIDGGSNSSCSASHLCSSSGTGTSSASCSGVTFQNTTACTFTFSGQICPSLPTVLTGSIDSSGAFLSTSCNGLDCVYKIDRSTLSDDFFYSILYIFILGGFIIGFFRFLYAKFN